MNYINATFRKTNSFHFTRTMFLTIMALFFLVPQMLRAASNNFTIDLSVNNANTTGFANWQCDASGNVYTITSFVTVTGNVNDASAALTFNISPGVTVNWIANYQGSVRTAYLVTLNGGGTVSLSSCTLSNAGTGGVFNISGAGATVSVGTGALLSSGGTGGNPVLISANNVTLNVYTGGSVVSLEGNGSAAIQVGSSLDITGVSVNVNGGAVTSIGGGYAINEGAPTGTVNNNTRITIGTNAGASGVVTAGTASAIRSTSLNTIVTINGGVVTNAAGNNANPTIYMNGGLGDNIIMSSGSVQSTSNAGYAIQTTGNVLVSGGLVSAVNGRAINLVGTNSKATVSGGVVQTTGNGTAISTATTNPETVTNASIEVTGGTVSSANGFAINITGANSTVAVSGSATVLTTATSTASDRHAINALGVNAEITISGNAAVSATTGNAINTVTAATNAKVVVEGNTKVSSSTGRAINTLSANSSVTVNGASQVWTLSTGSAINSNGIATLNSGFVFAYGANALGVVNAATITVPPGSWILVVAWDKAIGRTSYPQYVTLASSDDPDLDVRLNGSFANIGWHNHPALGGGIDYSYGATTGFFPIAEVTIVRDYGLIFNATNGGMYANIDHSGVPGGVNYQVFPLPFNWSGTPGSLTLDNFTWNTTEPVALTIWGQTTITLTNGSNNSFASTNTANSVGILSEYPVTIAVSGMNATGTLNAAGGSSTTGNSYGIEANDLTVNGGILTASGATSGMNIDNLTINNNGTVETKGDIRAFFDQPTAHLPLAYTYWTNTDMTDPGGLGTNYYHAPPTEYGTQYQYNAADKYVKITGGPFAIISDKTVTGTIGTTLANQTVTIKLYGEYVPLYFTSTNANPWFTYLPDGVRVRANAAGAYPTLNESSYIITLQFDGTPAVVSKEAFNITIPGVLLNGTSRTVIFNPEAKFNIGRVPHYLKPTNGIFYVKEGSSGDGSSWANAYPNVGDPLLFAAKQHSGLISVTNVANDRINEIWVADGTYYPMYDISDYDMASKTFHEFNGHRDNAFVLVKDVKLYGGFPSDANDTDNAPNQTLDKEQALATRNWYDNPTILSGELFYDDDENMVSENSYHVIISASDAGEALIDGFFISGGDADGSGDPVTVNSLTISSNDGGGMYNISSSPALRNTNISGNKATGYGGGIYHQNSLTTYINVAISGNLASNGGGMYNTASSPELTNVSISGNRANGGGIYNASASSPKIRNSIIYGNETNNILNNLSVPEYSFSLIEGSGGSGNNWDDDFGKDNNGNIDVNPLFAAPQPAMAAPATTGDYRLQAGSPAINKGNNNLYLSALGIPGFAGERDLEGRPRFSGIAINMGAYESSFCQCGQHTHTITVVDNPAGRGNVTGGGSYAEGENCTVTASADASTGYYFVNWTKDDVVVSIQEIYNFTVMECAMLVANFNVRTYTVTVTENNPAYGSATGDATDIVHGTEITVTATPVNTDFVFVNWTDANGAVVSTDEEYTFTVVENVELTANFKPEDRFFVTIVINPAGSGTVTGGGSYYMKGADVPVEAFALTGYDFVNWTDENMDVFSDNPYNILNIFRDVVLTANFALKTYAIDASANPVEGSVTGSGIYEHGEEVTVTATPNTGYEFVNWTKAGAEVSTNATYTFDANEDVTLVANFTVKNYTVTVAVNNDAYGVVTGGRTNIVHGTKITVSAVPTNTDFKFVNWTNASGAVVSTNEDYEFTVEEDVELTANFRLEDLYLLTIIVSPAEAGTVTGAGEYPPNHSIMVTATPNTGYDFVNWTKDGVEFLTPNFFTIDDDMVLTANFALKTYDINVSSTAGGTASGGGAYTHGDEVTVTATAEEGFTFVYWTRNGVPVSYNTSYIFTADADVAMVANFVLKTYTVLFSVIGGNGGIEAAISDVPVTSGEKVEHGANIVFTAIPDPGYRVREWTLNGAPVNGNTTNTYTLNPLSAPATVTVEFEAISSNDTEIDIITVDEVPATRLLDDFTAMATCGSNSVSVSVTTSDPNASVEIDGVSGNTNLVNLPNYGNNIIPITVRAQNGDEHAYTITINKRHLFWDFVYMRWNNTLSVINNPANNGGFNFVEYRWFQVGNTVPISSDQWWSAGAKGEELDTLHEFFVEVVTNDGTMMRTCPSYITLRKMAVKAYPSPVSTGQTVYLEADVDEELMKGAVIEVYDIAGNRVDYLMVQGRLTPININYTTGIYIFVLKGADGFTQELKVVVE